MHADSEEKSALETPCSSVYTHMDIIIIDAIKIRRIIKE